MKRVKPYQKEPTEKVNWGKKDKDKRLFKKTEKKQSVSQFTDVNVVLFSVKLRETL